MMSHLDGDRDPMARRSLRVDSEMRQRMVGGPWNGSSPELATELDDSEPLDAAGGRQRLGEAESPPDWAGSDQVCRSSPSSSS
jgi:hypothetical protein